MKKFFFILLVFICSIPANARHVAGGELFYEYIGPGEPGSSLYRITLRLFRECNSPGPILQSEQVSVGFYVQNSKVRTLQLFLTGSVNSISLDPSKFPCLVGNPTVCYQMALYTNNISLPDNMEGYTLARYGQYRVDRISNISQDTNVGSTYVTQIPGRITLPEGHNSSPQFNVRDTALVCANKKFKLDFGAVDPDNDSLSYSFCDAYLSFVNNQTDPPAILNLTSVPYASPYDGSNPLGNLVSINPVTGIISGIAPPVVFNRAGYVVNVCITEWRNGKPFSYHRKDFILKVQECDLIEADLPDMIIQCKDSVVHFENTSTSSGITSYQWEFGDKSGNISSDPTVDYHYSDTGRYMARLSVTGPKNCLGIDSTLVLVYPGFQPAFNVLGSCFTNPYQFTDMTVTKYGIVDSWRWDFGDLSTAADTSHLKNPTYKYPGSSNPNVELIVTSSKGCIDTARKSLTIRDKPILQLPFKDTLICSIDTLAIPVLNQGTFTWLPNKNILFPNTGRPLVFPKDTTRYFVTVTDNGCTNTDTVTVNVLDFITVKLGPDSTICKTDFVQLRPVSQGLQYRWSSSSGEAVSSVKFPLVKPLVNTLYAVTVNLGKCQASDSIRIKPIPYPTAYAGPDTVICNGARVRLTGSIQASSLSWSPGASLSATNILNPIAGPSRTTAYVLRVTDTLGCPKAVTDTVIITVTAPIIANAGRDTVAVPGQPIQLEASGSERYSWSPENFLNNPAIANPVATMDGSIDSIRYRVRVSDKNGCFGEDEIVIRVFRTAPDIFVPSAFTPNNDGRNDVIRPITAGITTLRFFRIFNRWGQLLFTTTEIGKGWNGVFKGGPQPPGTYVYEAEGTDYTGKNIVKKGTIVLIR